MEPERWREIEELYHAAVQREPAEREAFLNDACPDVRLRQEVESLFGYVQQGDELLENRPSPTGPSLAKGMRLGPYEIVAVIGAGGMGEVYEALDTRLGRKVAIKVSGKPFSERFERETRAIAALNHPNVCTVYDVGPSYLVMELVEGQTLAARLRKGSLPAEKVIRHGAEIADALAAAHSRGIIHRDLKPANIMLTRTGAKVLDFGLAKFAQPVDPGRPPAKLTGDRVVLGTLTYMSPEQLAGQECDARSDIYSFGLVLYEMLTGEPPQNGVAVGLRNELRLDVGRTPLERIVRKCLAHDPDERWQSARDLKTSLEWANHLLEPEPRTRLRPTKTMGGITAAALLVVALVGWVVRGVFSPTSEPVRAHFVVRPPEGTRIGLRLPNKPLAAVAPDGQKLVLVAQDDAGVRSLWLRPLNSTTYQHLNQTEGASLAFWSPDSQSIAFFADEKLKRIPVSGGPPQTICDTGPGDGEGGSWSRNGVILFPTPRKAAAALPTGALYRVPAAGGRAEPATALKTGELSHSWPQFMPDGRHFLYLARNQDPEKTLVVAQELGSQDRRTVLTSKILANYAKGPSGQPYLLFPRDRALLAQPLKLSTLELYGEPTPVATDVSYNTLYGTSGFSTSDNGVLIYRSGTFGRSNTPIRQLAWYSRDGRRLGDVGVAGAFQSIALSPDETRVAVTRKVKLDDLKDWDIWILELASGVFSRLTFGPEFFSPVWAPDSRKIAAVSSVGNREEIVEITTASGSTKVLLFDQDPKAVQTWTPDGREVLFVAGRALTEPNPSAMHSAFRLPLAKGSAEPIFESDFFKGRFAVSANGSWIAYQSNESGKREVYVSSFPSLGQKRQASTAGGSQPLWRRDGRELFYLAPDGKLMALGVKSGTSLETGTPRILFQTPIDGNPDLGQYAVTRDGQKFLLMEPAREGAATTIEEFHIELNWYSELAVRK